MIEKRRAIIITIFAATQSYRARQFCTDNNFEGIVTNDDLSNIIHMKHTIKSSPLTNDEELQMNQTGRKATKEGCRRLTERGNTNSILVKTVRWPDSIPVFF